ncbi:fibronectin type III domain-containing protein [Paenibacillus gansuensis]|uniref:Fibronectin type III domain-containing protein n=1 Tax=Paenibacillus gansuensis TaxID=306542 RepID=A0ABW5PEA9_9BACL
MKKWCGFLSTVLLSVWCGSLASAATYDETYYILPNTWPSPPQQRINTEYNGIVNSIGQSPYVKTGLSIQTSYLSLDTLSHQQNYNWDPNFLDQQLKYAETNQKPVLIQLNAGGWAGDAGLMHALQDDTRTTMWDTNNWDMFRSIDQHNYMTYSRKNLKHYAFKKRNLQLAAQRLVEWRAAHPDLLVGVSLDSEDWQYVWDGTRYSDYNPLSISEWKEWLTGTGMYDPVNGAYKGEARNPVFTSIGQFNTAMGTSFASWNAVDPPRTRADGNPFWEEWSRWRTMLLKHHLQDLTNWLIEAGLPANRIFSHQNHITSGSDGYYLTSSILTTADLSPGSLGVTLYGDATKDTDYMKQVLGYNNNWGAPEYNPQQKTDKAYNYDGLVKTYEGGAHYISPLSWNDPVTSPYEIKNTQFETAMQEFVAAYGNQRRPARFDINSPGTLVYDLKANFSQAVVSNTISGTAGTYTVGGTAKDGIFLHAPNTGDATAVYSNVALPNVTNGERLNIAIHSGLADGANTSDGYKVKVLVNGTAVFTGDYSQPHYSLWHRWEPAMIDVTNYAGQTVQITLVSNKGKSTSSHDWVVFGTPAIYKGTPDYTPPSAVGTLTASTAGSHRIGLSWTAIANQGVAEYKIYRSTSAGFTPSAANFVGFSNRAGYTDRGLNPSTTYYYKVSALDEAGNEGAYSSQASAATAANSTTAPPQLTGVSAALDSSRDFVTLNWNASSAGNVREYRIYRSTKSVFTADNTQQIANVPAASGTSYKDYYLFDNKTYYYQIAACDVNDNCSPVTSVVSVPVAGNSAAWSFNTSGNFEGWTVANDVSGSSVNGQLNFTITGNDPYIVSPAQLNLRGKRSHYVRVVMKNNTAGTSAQLFWTTDQNASYSGNQQLTIPIVANDTQYRTYWFDLGNNYQFAGILQNLRLDLNASSGTVNIDSIEVIEGPDLLPWEFNQTGNTEGWTAGPQIYSAVVNGGALKLSMTNRTAPYIESQGNLKIQARANQSIRMYAKNATSAFQATVQWTTETDSAWDANKSSVIQIQPGDTGLTDYVFPVGANGNWSGTINKIRIYPFSSDGSTAFTGTVDIDRIAVAGHLPVNDAVPFGIPGNGKVDLYWAQNRRDTGANVYRSTSYNGNYTKINTNPVSMHFEDTTAVNGQTYYYKIQYTNWLGSGIVTRPTGALRPAAGTVTLKEPNFVSYVGGVGNWYFETYNGTSYSPMTYVHDQAFNDYWSGGGAKISRVSSNPAVGSDAVLKWVSPVTGTLTITGSPQYIVNDRTQGDGADVKIMKNGTQLWSASLNPFSFAAESAVHNVTVSVNQGDVLYFHVNAKNDALKESVWWNPQISY